MAKPTAVCLEAPDLPLDLNQLSFFVLNVIFDLPHLMLRSLAVPVHL